MSVYYLLISLNHLISLADTCGTTPCESQCFSITYMLIIENLIYHFNEGSYNIFNYIYFKLFMLNKYNDFIDVTLTFRNV